MRNMGGLRRYLPWTWALMGIATLAIAGIPPFAGFFSKDEILAFAWGRGEHDAAWKVFWAMGSLAALLTAFYMARLMALTFLGENRTGEKEREHLHEAPPTMTGPLIGLGILTVVGGVLNLPSFWPTPPHHALDHWLEPVVEPATRFLTAELPHGSTEYLLIGLAVLIGVAGLIWGVRATLSRPIPTAIAAPEERGLWKTIHRKWYVDELYDEFIVQPVIRLSRLLWRVVDQKVIDGAGVNGSAWLSRRLGWLGSRLQTGEVGVYIVLFLLGAAWILHAIVR
jgi:NADH-quinone oxidoreductase subunit L